MIALLQKRFEVSIRSKVRGFEGIQGEVKWSKNRGLAFSFSLIHFYSSFFFQTVLS